MRNGFVETLPDISEPIRGIDVDQGPHLADQLVKMLTLRRIHVYSLCSLCSKGRFHILSYLEQGVSVIFTKGEATTFVRPLLGSHDVRHGIDQILEFAQLSSLSFAWFAKPQRSLVRKPNSQGP